MTMQNSENFSENSEFTERLSGFFHEASVDESHSTESVAEEISIGTILRQKREDLKLEIRDISTRLKVKIPDLKALEEDDLESITKHLYIPGFITSYSKILKLDQKLMGEKIKALEIRSNTDNKDHQLINIGEESDLTPARELTVNALLISILLMLILLSFYHSYENRDNLITNQDLIREMESIQLQNG